MSETKEKNGYGIFVNGVLSAWKVTKKGGFLTVSTGSDTINIFKSDDSRFKLPELFTPIKCNISVGQNGFCSLVD